MTPARAVLFGLAGWFAAGMPIMTPASDIANEVQLVLTSHLHFSNDDLAELSRGKAVRHALDTRTPGEVAVVAAVRVHAGKAAFLNRVRDIVAFKRGPSVLQIGRIGRTPSVEDLASLTVDKDDFDVRKCRQGDCPVRLSADAIRRLPQEIDLKARDAQARGAAWFKQLLIADVQAYLSGGSGRMSQYDDGPKPIRPIDEFEGILDNMSSLGVLMPDLPEYLRRFPGLRLPAAEDFLYWSKERAGASPFITVTHVTIVCPTPATCIVTTKDVYSSRYLDASLGLTIASDSPADPTVFYLVYANRFRVNALKDGWGAVARSLVERRARSALAENLKTIKMALEQRDGRGDPD